MIPALIEAALRALVVALMVWAGLRLFRVCNVLAQKAAWGLVLAAAVAMPLMMRWQWLPAKAQVRLRAPAWQQEAEASQPGTAAPFSALSSSPSAAPLPQLSAAPVSEPPAGDRFPAPTISKVEFNPPSQVRPEPPAYPRKPLAPPSEIGFFRLVTIGVFLYCAVCAVLLLRLLYGVGSAVRLWLAAEPVSLERGRDIAPGLRLRSSHAVFSPVTIGSGMVLPADYVEWDAEKLGIVLAHERSHIRQGDFYLQMLAGLYAALFWFSPLGWWLKHRLSDLGEAISDRAGVEQAASRASYAQVLLEFAAMPRPTPIGVAMARSSNLSHRIERLLNETSFRQAFAGSRRRALLVGLLVPVALFAGTALVRVEASATGQAVQPPPPQTAAISGQALPDQAPEPAAAPNQVDPGGPPAPAMPQAPIDPAAPPPLNGPGSTVVPQGEPPTAPLPPEPPMGEGEGIGSGIGLGIAGSQGQHTSVSNGNGRGYSYSYSSNGDSWALVTDPSERVTFSGEWHNSSRESIDKVRKLTSGKFLWFTRNGKSYFIDDAEIMGQIEAMYKPMEELGRQQEILGKKQEALGRQQEEMGHRQELVSIPAPDISKEMAELNAAVAKLQAKKGGTVSQEELAEIEGKIGDIQGRLGDLQGKLGDQQGELGAQQGKLGELQGKLGAEQGHLGAEQGRIAAEADQKVRAIIDESLRNGKARPVE